MEKRRRGEAFLIYSYDGIYLILLIYSYDGIIFLLDKRTHKNSRSKSCKFKLLLEGSKDDFNTQVIFCFYLFTVKRLQNDKCQMS